MLFASPLILDPSDFNRADIEKMKKDREELMLNLQLLESKHNQQQDQEDMESIQNSLSYQEKLEEQITNEKQSIKDLEVEVKMWLTTWH